MWNTRWGQHRWYRASWYGTSWDANQTSRTPPIQPEEASEPFESSLPALVSVGSLMEMAFQRIEELFELERRWMWDPRPWQQRWAEPATLQHIEELLAAAVGVVDQEDIEQRLDRRIDEYWHPDQPPGWRNFDGIRRSLCAERDATRPRLATRL